MTMNFARNFTVLRRENNLTQEKMAEKCGVSRGAVTKWETGDSVPNLYMLEKIIKIFNVTADEILFEKLGKPESIFDNDNDAALISEKIDEAKKEIIAEIRKRDNSTDLYDVHCKYINEMFEDDVPIEAYSYWGNEEALKGNYEEALKYYEEAVIRGDVNSAFTILSIYEDMVDMYAYDCNMPDILQTRLIEAVKMQQYGKIIEEVINRELKSGIHNV
ncbi:MAG: helix-turn-helix domain-containing protein [Clostridia bacterium]|nr:helix-turn-helix domain-containing protein [Clostridia bacterium]